MPENLWDGLDDAKAAASDASLNASWKLDPERQAKVQALARQMGVAPATADTEFDQLDAMRKREAAAALLEKAPATRQFLTNPDHAAIAHDQTEALARIEQKAKRTPAGSIDLIPRGEVFGFDYLKAFAESPVGNLSSGIVERVPQLAAGLGRTLFGLVDRPADLLASGAEALGIPTIIEFTPKGVKGRMQTPAEKQSLTGGGYAEQAIRAGEGFRTAYKPGTSWEDVKRQPVTKFLPFALEQGIVSAPDMAAAVLALPAYVAARTGEIGGDRATNDGRQEATVEDLFAALPAAAGSAALERLGTRGILGLDDALKGGLKGVPAAVGKASLKEGLTEAGQQVLESLGATVGTKKGVDGAALLDETLAAAAGGAGFGGVVRAGTGTLEAFSGESRKAESAKDDAAKLDDLVQEVSANPLTARDPEAMRAFLEGVTEGEVHIPAKAVMAYLQARRFDDVDAVLDEWGISDQMQEAMAADADIVVDTSVYLSKIAPQHHDAFREDLRIGSGSMSLREAAEFDAGRDDGLQDAAQKVLDQSAAELEAAAPAEQVYQTLYGQALDAGYVPDVARQYAELWAARYAARAARSPELYADALEAFNASQVSVRAAMPEALNTRRTMLDVVINALRVRAKPDAGEALFGPSLLSFVSKQGGIVDTGGELARMDAGTWHIKNKKVGRRKLIRDVKDPTDTVNYGAERMAEKAFDVGYITEPTEEALLAAVQEELAGRLQFPSDAQSRTTQAREDFGQAVEQLDEILGRLGLDVGDPQVTNEQIRAAVEAYAADPQAATSLFQGGVDAYTRRDPAVEGEQTGVRLANNLATVAALARDARFANGRDFKVTLQERALAAQAEQGVDLRGLDDATAERLADYAVEDALEAVQDNQNAIGWYDKTVTEALTELARLYPEIATDPHAKLAFTWALAVTSNGLKVNKNFELAADAYEVWRETGEFPARIGIGTAAGKIDEGLALFGQLIEQMGSWQAVRDFMIQEYAVRDIQPLTGLKISGEGQAQIVRGAAILGPKIGNGFFSNLYGLFDGLTMDRWLMRTVGRWRGTLIAINPKMVEQKQGEIRALIAGLGGNSAPALNGLLRQSGIELRRDFTDAEINDLSLAIAKESSSPEWRAKINELPYGEDLRKLGNALAKYLDGQVEQPAGARERAFLRQVFRTALARLQQKEGMSTLTMADLQALLWYPEKLLYESAKKPAGQEVRSYEDDDAPDYANAARTLVRNRLGSSGRSGGRPGAAGSGTGDPAVPAGPGQSQGRAGDGNGNPAGTADPAVAVTSYDQSAYHGSPHVFDRFSTDAMGTGEGAQAYGWGLYFASRKEVAAHYREALTKRQADARWKGKSFDEINETLGRPQDDPGGWDALQALAQIEALGGIDQAISALESSKVQGDQAVGAWIKEHRADIEVSAKGRLYEVDIPEDGEFLLHDQPFDRQPPKVRAALEKLGIEGPRPPPPIQDPVIAQIVAKALKDSAGENNPMGDVDQVALIIDNDADLYRQASAHAEARGINIEDDGPGAYVEDLARDHLDALRFAENLTGVRIYNDLSRSIAAQAEFKPGVTKDDQAASKALHDVGIAGIKYLDGGSRTAGDGSYNYVVFDDSRVQITSYEQSARGVFTGSVDAMMASEFPGVEYAISDNGPTATIAKLVIPPGSRGEGVGSAVMRRLVGMADAAGVRLALTPDTSYGSSKARLIKFYKRFGFVENKGRGRSFTTSEDMVRNPPGRIYDQPADGSGMAPRGRIDLMSDMSRIITLFESRDLSTLLHEGGHLWLEELRQDAAMGSVSAAAELDIINDWFGKNGLVDPVDQHEAWARAAEAYLMEGKAPSQALKGAFSKFRSWLKSIYRTVAGLNTPINDDIRGVMDRLLATDAEIQAARQSVSADPMFTTAMEAGMTEAEFTAYNKAVERSKDATHDALLVKVMNAITRERTAEWKAEAEDLRPEAIETVDAAPEMRALNWLRSNRQALSREAVIDVLGDASAVALLPKGVPPLISEKGGIHPDSLADVAGYQSGQEMLLGLMSIEAERQAMKAKNDKRSVRTARIDAEVARIQTERHGDPFTDGSIQREAMDAIHHERQGEVLAEELRALGRKVGQNPTPLQMLREWARATVAGKKMRDATRTDRYLRAERKAANAAQQAAARGDNATALKEKQTQTLNHLLYNESTKAAAMAERAVKLFSRYAKARTLKGMDQDYLEQIHGLLEQYDFAPTTLRGADRRAALAAWVKARQDAGEEVLVPEALLTRAGKTSYVNMTMEELTGLYDAVRSIAHLGKLKQKLLDGREQRAFEAVIDEVTSQTQDLPTVRDLAIANPKKNWGALADAALIKVETMLDWLDRGDVNGVFNRLLIRPATDAANLEGQLREKISKALGEHREAVPKAQRKAWLKAWTSPLLLEPRTGQPLKLQRGDLIAMALNVGNASNLDKLARGYGWSPDTILNVLNQNLTKEEWAYVQGVWTTVGSLWPDIAATERKLTGVEPEAVIPQAVVTPFGTLPGGYYPVVYDYERTTKAPEWAAKEAADMFNGVFYSTGTPKGHTQARTGFAAPITLSVSRVLGGHVNKVIKRIAYAEFVMSAKKIIEDRRVRQIIQAKLGPEYYNLLMPWLQRQVVDQVIPSSELAGWEAFIRKARVNFQIVAMGFRASTILAQFAGLTSSAAVIGPQWVAKGTAEAVRLIATEGNFNFVFSRSAEMDQRSRELDRDLRDAMRDFEDGEGLLDPIRRGAFMLIGFTDRYAVAVPTWLGAYNKAISQGMSEDDAIAASDKAVRSSQGSGRAKDLAAWQAPNSEFARLFTMFYSYFNVQYQRQRDAGRMAARGDVVPALYMSLWMLFAAPLAGALLTGDWPDLEDEDGLMEWLGSKLFVNLWAGVPGARDAASYLEKKVTGKYSEYSITPLSRVVGSVEDTLGDIVKLVKDGEPGDRWIKHAIETPGYFVGLPTGQLSSSTQYLFDWIDGDQNPENMWEFLYGLAKGPQKDQE